MKRFLLAMLLLLAASPAIAAPTTWTCLQRGVELTYTLNSSYRPHCTNTLTFTGTAPAIGDMVFSWSVASTSNNGPLPSWNVGPWEQNQDISIISMTLSRAVGPAGCHMYVGSTFNGDLLLDLPPDQVSVASAWSGMGAALLFPGVNDNPPSPGAYFDLHASCPPGSQVIAILNITYVPEGSNLPPPPPGSVAWNLADKAPSIALTNNNLSAAGSGGTFGSVRATQGYSTGKLHWENLVTGVTGATSVVGFGTSGMVLGNYVGATATSAGVQANGSSSANGMTCGATGVSFAANDVQTFEIDLDAHKAWLAKNGVFVGGGNPAAGTSPWCTWTGTLTLFAAFSSAGSADSGTARFSAPAFTTPVSSGFSPYSTQ